VPLSLLIGGVLSVAGGAGAWLWLRRIHPEPRRVQRSALASADIGAIDPEGRSAGVIGRARPR
jgi:hypothetical protein